MLDVQDKKYWFWTYSNKELEKLDIGDWYCFNWSLYEKDFKINKMNEEEKKLTKALRFIFEKLRASYNKDEFIPNRSWVRNKHSGDVTYIVKEIDKERFEDKNGIQYLYVDFE